MILISPISTKEQRFLRSFLRNPQIGAEIKTKAKKVARFVPGKALKDAVG